MRLNVKSFCEFVKDGGFPTLEGKSIFLWGNMRGEGKLVLDALLVARRNVEGCIENNDRKDECMVLKVIQREEILSYENIYIIVMERNNDIIAFLNKAGFRYYEDYIVVDKEERVLHTVQDYADIEGNIVDSQTYIRDCYIVIQGYASRLYIGADVSFGKNCKIAMGYNSTISIGDHCIFGDDTEINVWEGATLEIGAHCSFGKNSLISSANRITIGNENWFGFDTHFVTGYDGKIEIGNDCLFSNYIKFRPDNGHSVFDVDLQKDLKELHSNEIIIGDHVWVGIDVIALGDTTVEAGSMVGAGSLLKGSYPVHCAVAGNPAHIIRENILWDKAACKQWVCAGEREKR